MSLFTNLRRFLGSVFSFSGEPNPEEAHSPAPGTVIFRTPDGRKITTEDLYGAEGTVDFCEGKLLGVTGRVQYEIIGESSASPRAHSLHQQGRQAGSRGEYARAVDLLEQASRLAPKWPYPVYDLGFTYLLMGDCESARGCYSKTIELSPRGFFTAITAVDTLTREHIGMLPAGTYARWLSLDSMNDPERQAEVVHQLVAHVPQFAPGWQKLAAFTEDDSERLAIIDRGLAAQPDAETRGMLMISKALIFNLKGQREAAIKLLGELVLNPTSTFGTEHSAKAALSILSAR